MSSGRRVVRERKVRALVIEPECLEDLRWWVDTNRKAALRIIELIEAIMRDPFSGIGKPEPLRHLRANLWSRRITRQDRLVYLVLHDRVNLLQARYHY
ncbi:MAG: Txe/YoeB family addiction module toxin [Gemmatimonadaceae bacterium]